MGLYHLRNSKLESMLCLQPIRSHEEKFLLIQYFLTWIFFLEIQAPGSNMLKSFRITACDVG